MITMEEWVSAQSKIKKEWLKTAPVLTEEKAQFVVDRVLQGFGEISQDIGILCYNLRKNGIWMSEASEIEDFHIDPRPMYKTADGNMRKMKMIICISFDEKK